ncbi:MAG TPA: amino acid ABC transporter permease [Candidatus Dormibacteraeota bacterium]|nr:amino acid ABC transporter permease [Candidatus Dormibacteraeota bacterium]
MTAAELRPARAPILDDIVAAQRRRRRWFRGQFIVVWVVLVGIIGVFLWSSGKVSWDFIFQSGPYILQGAGITILVSLVGIVLAIVLALLGALGRLSSNAIAYSLASLYVSLVRGTPLLVQIYFIYFGLAFAGIRLDAIPAGIIALGFNYGAYMTEIFRAGIQAVPRSQLEAAQALGMPERLAFRRIVLPQAVRIVIPAIGNDFVAMIKDSALVSTIAVTELLWRAQRVGRSEHQVLAALTIAAVVYWGLTIIFSFFQERLEKRMARGDR